MTVGGEEVEAQATRKVLVIDNDRDVTDLVYAILTDEGFAVSTLHDQSIDAIRTAINLGEPDCVLLDGQSISEYGQSWDEAAWLSSRDRRVPTIMFTAHADDLKEAAAGDSPRSRAAAFAGILPKPFDIDELIDKVTSAVGDSGPFDTSAAAEQDRTVALLARLQAAGGRDVHVSTRREWANFVSPHEKFTQLYWWQRDGVYYVVHHAEVGGVLRTLGRFYDLDTAIGMAMRE